MTLNANQIKILAAIKARGWCNADSYWNDGNALYKAGMIKIGEKFTTGGNRKTVWVAA